MCMANLSPGLLYLLWTYTDPRDFRIRLIITNLFVSITWSNLKHAAVTTSLVQAKKQLQHHSLKLKARAELCIWTAIAMISWGKQPKTMETTSQLGTAPTASILAACWPQPWTSASLSSRPLCWEDLLMTWTLTRWANLFHRSRRSSCNWSYSCKWWCPFQVDAASSLHPQKLRPAAVIQRLVIRHGIT